MQINIVSSSPARGAATCCRVQRSVPFILTHNNEAKRLCGLTLEAFPRTREMDPRLPKVLPAQQLGSSQADPIHRYTHGTVSWVKSMGTELSSLICTGTRRVQCEAGLNVPTSVGLLCMGDLVV